MTTPVFSQTFDIPVHQMFEDKDMGFTYSVNDHASGEGHHVIIRFDNGYGLSIVNAPILHAYEYYCEVAIIKYSGPSHWDWNLTYDTEWTDDVLVFYSHEEFKQWFFPVAMWGHCAPEDVRLVPRDREDDDKEDE